MKQVIIALAVAGALLTGAPAAAQGTYPAKPIVIVVPFPPGGGTDTSARWIGQQLSDRLKQPVVVDNKPGASGSIGADFVARAKPDGYTLLVSNAQAQTIIPALMKLNYNAETAFAPISEIAELPLVLLVNSSLPVHTTREFIELVKAKPGDLKYSSAGNGSSTQLAAALFEGATGTRVLHVPYKGGGPAMQDLMAGHVDFTFLTVLESGPAMKSGKVRAIAVTSAKRSPALPNVPTLAESGVPSYFSVSWSGMLAPAGTPKPIIDKLAHAVSDIVRSPDMSTRLTEQGATPIGSTPEEFSVFIASEMRRYKTLITEKNIKPD